MTCPKCSSPMEVVAVGSIIVDRCPACGGMWFDLFEEERVKRTGGAATLDTGQPPTDAHENARKILCPRCKSPMLRMVDATQPHIWYESCGVCYGTFFDAGEFRDFADENIGDLFRSWGAKERR